MRVKPWPIVVLALFHIVNPFFCVIASAWLLQVDLITYLTSLKWSWRTIEFFTLFPLAGIALWQCRKWSYVVFLAVWGWSFYTNFQSFDNYPQLFPLPFFIINSLLSLLLVSYFFIPAVRAVYFNPRVRWWESKPRYLFNFAAQLESPRMNEPQEVNIADISLGGVFLSGDVRLDLRDTIQLKMPLDEIGEVAVRGEVVHVNQKGQNSYGVKFLEMDRTTRRSLRQFINHLQSKGVASNREDRNSWQDFISWFKNLMKTGRGVIPELPERRG